MCDVNIATGELERSHTDLFLPGYLPIEFTRIYNSRNSDAGFLGRGWRHSLNERLRIVEGVVEYDDGLGTVLKLEPDSTTSQLINQNGNVSLVEDEGQWILHDAFGCRHFFPSPSGLSPELSPYRIADTYGNTLEFTYLADARTFTIIDQLGRSVVFAMDDLQRLRTIKAYSLGEAKTIEIHYGFDNQSRLTWVADPIGRVTSYEYDRELLVRENRPDGTDIVWKYDRSGRCIETWRSGGVFYRRLAFDDARKRVRVTNSLGYTHTYQLDETASIVQETDPLGDTTETFLDETGETIGSSRNGQGEASCTLFDKASNSLKSTLPFGAFVYQFNELDQLVAISSEDGGLWRFKYNDLGETILEERPGGMCFSAEYSPQGWVRRVTASSGYCIEQQCSDDRRQIKLSDSYGVLCVMRLDGFGSLVGVSDEIHPEIRLSYDNVGRLVRIHPGDQQPREARYDANDNIEQIVTETGLLWSFRFGSGGVVELAATPSGARTECRYDSEQQLVYIRKPNGEEVNIEYDQIGRPCTVYLPGEMKESYEYDVFSQISAVSVNDKLHRRCTYRDGRVVSIEYADGKQREFNWVGGMPAGGRYLGHVVSRRFDERSRLLEERAGDADSRIALEYDAADNLLSISDAKNRDTRFRYDGRKRLTHIEDSRCGTHQFEYEVGCEMSEWHIEGGCEVRFFHDPVGMLKGFVATGPDGTMIANHSTIYGVDGKVLVESLRTGEEEIVTEYRHDANGRPIVVARSGSDVMSYRYDANGNVVFSSERGDWLIGANDRLTQAGGLSYEYDDLGRVVRRQDQMSTWTYRYSSASELIRASRQDGVAVDFSYDVFGRLRSRSTDRSKTTFVWLENSILNESSEEYERAFLFLPTTFFCISVYDSRFGKAFLCPDRTGSPVCMISFDGTILWRREFRLFGSIPASDAYAGKTSPIGFLGQYQEPISGLAYNYARFYDAATGRYLTPDPIGFAAGTNFYAYTADPLTAVDPFGLVPISLGAPPLWCHWNRQQRKEYRDKVNRYNAHIKIREKKEGEGLLVSKCERLGKKASQQWASSKCCNNTPPKQRKPKGKGTSQDCTKDIDHIIDCQLGGDQICPDVCDNLIPVNTSVNSSFGPTMEAELGKIAGQFLTEVTFKPARCKKHTPRTPKCI